MKAMMPLKLLGIGVFGALLAACVTPMPRAQVAPEPLKFATGQSAEAELLDVWIEIFTAAPVSADQTEKTGTSAEIRQAETRFVPVHLKATLDAAGHWGSVRVVPEGAFGADLKVEGSVVRSDGRALKLAIVARDSRGAAWLSRTYSKEVVAADFDSIVRGEHDAFQDVYNRIANDLAEMLAEMPAQDLREIRQTSAVQFAADLAPQPYQEYLARDQREYITAIRLPAENDPLYQRILALRARDGLLADTLNTYYQQFYDDVWDAYGSWRIASLEEILLLEQMKREATNKKMAGAAAILGAIAINIFGGGNTGTLETVMIAGGALAIKAGIDQRAAAKIHESAIAELGQSFEAEVSPRVVNLDGETVELTGSADEQYMNWRELLHRRYEIESGVAPALTAAPDVITGDRITSNPESGPLPEPAR